MQYYGLETVHSPRRFETDAAENIYKALVANMIPDEYAQISVRIAEKLGDQTSRLIIDVELGDTTLPIDMGTWALNAENHDRATAVAFARVCEILSFRNDINRNIRDIRTGITNLLQTEQPFSKLNSIFYWPIDGSKRLLLKQLLLEVRFECFATNFSKIVISDHGRYITDLTQCIRKGKRLQRRIHELREILIKADVPLELDISTQTKLIQTRILPRKLAEPVIAAARNRA